MPFKNYPPHGAVGVFLVHTEMKWIINENTLDIPEM